MKAEGVLGAADADNNGPADDLQSFPSSAVRPPAVC